MARRREQRKKVGDLFHERQPVFGSTRKIAEVYPSIQDITVDVQEYGSGVGRERAGRHRYTKESIEEFVCSNPFCYLGGFQLGSHLSQMVTRKQTELEDSTMCCGNESSPKGRRIYRKCTNTFGFKIAIKYKDTDSQVHEMSTGSNTILEDFIAVEYALQRLGVSPIGTHQLMTAQLVTDPQDRAKIAAIVGLAFDIRNRGAVALPPNNKMVELTSWGFGS